MLAIDASKEMYLSFTKGPLRSMRKDYTHKRASQGGTYDPVTETTTGGTPALDGILNGILRDVKRKLVDGVNITNSMSQLTVLQKDIPNIPQINDSIGDGNPVDYRVVDVLSDPANVFYHLILKRGA